jgi:polyisoprenoid-binding protein YceI
MKTMLMTMRRSGFSLALAVALGGPAAAQVQVQNSGSEIVFTTRQMGVPVEGRFGKFSAVIVLDPKAPEAGKVRLAIDTGSARFGSPELDAEVVQPGWLSSAKFPQALFTSSRIKAAGAGRFEVTGKLSIKGSEREVVVPVSLVQQGGSGTATGTFTVKRLDFKVGEAEWADTSLLAGDVLVRFKLALTGLAPP